MKRTVYIYRYEYDRPGGRKPVTYTLAYMTYQTKGACVHEVEAASGYDARRIAKDEHVVRCGNRVTR